MTAGTRHRERVDESMDDCADEIIVESTSESARKRCGETQNCNNQKKIARGRLPGKRNNHVKEGAYARLNQTWIKEGLKVKMEARLPGRMTT